MTPEQLRLVNIFLSQQCPPPFASPETTTLVFWSEDNLLVVGDKTFLAIQAMRDELVRRMGRYVVTGPIREQCEIPIPEEQDE